LIPPDKSFHAEFYVILTVKGKIIFYVFRHQNFIIQSSASDHFQKPFSPKESKNPTPTETFFFEKNANHKNFSAFFP
jgi:hypothetical protein